MSTLRVNNVNEVGGDSVITAGILDSGSLPAGSILQVVRATDTTNRLTNSTSFIDVDGMSVTITPTATSSNIFVVASFEARTEDGNDRTQAIYQITDSSDTALTGAEEMALLSDAGGASDTFIISPLTLIGFDSPASTSAQTYKLRFRRASGTAVCQNNQNTGQMIAIEVAA